jgi:hypothetical protein
MSFVPGSVQSRADWNFVSLWDLHKPDKGEKIYKPLGSQLLTDILSYVDGGSAPTSSLQYEHYEEEFLMPKIKATGAGGAAGASVTFTVHTDADIAKSQGQTPYGGTPVTNQMVPVRVNDLILIKPASGVVSASSYVRAIVTAVTASNTAGATTFAARPIDSTDSIPAVTADEVVIYGNGHGEGSAQPLGLNAKVNKYTNQLQTIKDTFQQTGLESNMVMWHQVTDAKGRKGYVWSIKGEDDAFKRFRNNRELVLMLGEKLSSTAVADAFATANEPLSLTEGLIPFALGGTVQNYSAALGLQLSDLEDMAREINVNKGSMENMLLCGFDLSIQIDSLLRGEYAAGAIQFGNYKFDQNAKANFMFDTFKIGGYTFHKKTLDAFSDQQTLGATGFGFTNEGIVIPMDTRVDSNSGETVPSLRKRYLADPVTGANKEFEVAMYDGFKSASDGKDVLEVRYKSYCGFEGFGAKRFGYLKQV